MNQRLRVALAVAGIAIYAIWCATKAYGHDAQVPHTHADMVVVSTTAFNNITGATNDINTNVNLQTVLDAIDNSTLPTASNIVINTNNFQYFAPTNAYLQTLLDWQDDNALTNISNTNVYMTGVQNSNSFIGHSSTDYISAAGGQVNNKHMAGGSVNRSNLSSSALGFLLGASTWTNIDVNGNDSAIGTVTSICAGCGGAEVTMTNPITNSAANAYMFYAYLIQRSAAIQGTDLITVTLRYKHPGGSFGDVYAATAHTVTFTAATFTANSMSVPAGFSFVVPSGTVWQIVMNPGSSLGSSSYTSTWSCLKLVQ